MPGRYSLLWRLSAVLCLSAVLVVWLSWHLTMQVGERVLRLGTEAKSTLHGYAAEAEQAWRGGDDAMRQWLSTLQAREPGDAMLVDQHGVSLTSVPLTEHQRAGLRFQRELDYRMSLRSVEMPYIGIPFPQAPEAGRLVMQLPPRFFPGRVIPFWRALLMGVLPALLALLLGVLVYRQLMRPLRALEAQVLRFRDDPQARVAPELAARRDEFGQVGESFNLMAERVAGVLGAQRQLLHDMSHELRTPLSRLSVALDGKLSEDALRERVARELALMSALVDDTLELAWHDMVQPVSSTETVTLGPMWDLVVENVAFEAGWPVSRFPNRLPEDARVRAHVNDLARTLENLVRNAVRHSPPEGEVRLQGQREGDMWHLWVADQGPGVAPEALARIFEPFVRLDTAREQGSGFGLGLSIARRAVVRQGGTLWAENGAPGLRVHLRLPAVE